MRDTTLVHIIVHSQDSSYTRDVQMISILFLILQNDSFKR